MTLRRFDGHCRVGYCYVVLDRAVSETPGAKRGGSPLRIIAAAVGTPPVLDIEGLVSPISEAVPCGGDPRSDPSPTSMYQALKDARHAAADAERGLERGFAEEDDAKKADETLKKSWSLILAQGPPLIKSVAKDLEVAAWVTEAALRAHHLAGLRDGLRCTAELVDRYWDEVFPLPDEDGLETRLAPLAGLSGGDTEGRLITPLKKVALTEGDDPPPIAFWQYERAANSTSGKAEGGVTVAAFETALRRSSPEYVRGLTEDAQACLDAATWLEAALEARCASEAPSFSRLRETLSQMLGALRAHGCVAAEEPPAAGEPAAAEPEMSGAPGETSIAAAPARGPILDRQGAFRQLEELAAFFRRTEPHSPIAYAIENLVRRGRMSFSELVEELIADGNVRRDYFVNAGIQPPPGGGKGA
jgi:type VI secretion system protein ImpA